MDEALHGIYSVTIKFRLESDITEGEARDMVEDLIDGNNEDWSRNVESAEVTNIEG